jgi:hypothetical protein
VPGAESDARAGLDASSAPRLGGEAFLLFEAHGLSAASSAITSEEAASTPPGRNRGVAAQQRRERRTLVLAGDEPQQWSARASAG